MWQARTVFILLLGSKALFASDELNLMRNGEIIDDINHCRTESSQFPPFFVSDTSDPSTHPWYENIRRGDTLNSSHIGDLAIGSIIHVTEEDEQNVDSNNYVYMRVVRQSRYKHKLEKPVRNQFEGFIFGRSVDKPEEWQFLVEESEVLNGRNEEEKYFFNGKSLVVSRNDSGYHYLTCCSGQECTDNPIFAIFDESLKTSYGFVALDVNELNFIQALTPLRNRNKKTLSVTLPEVEAIAKPSNTFVVSKRRSDSTFSTDDIVQQIKGRVSHAPIPRSRAKHIGNAEAGSMSDLPFPRSRPQHLVANEAYKSDLPLPRPRPRQLERIASHSYFFPLLSSPTHSFTSGIRRFAAGRGRRKHAGTDLYRPRGSKVVAMASGIVLRVAYFYRGTWAVEVLNDDGRVIRYTEIHKKVARGIKAGARIVRGQHIGQVGRMRGISRTMLHLEIYQGTRSGNLTVFGNRPYQRRKDLINPTPILQSLLRKRLFARR